MRGLKEPCQVKSEKDRKALLDRMGIKQEPPRHMRTWPGPDNHPDRAWKIPFAGVRWRDIRTEDNQGTQDSGTESSEETTGQAASAPAADGDVLPPPTPPPGMQQILRARIEANRAAALARRQARQVALRGRPTGLDMEDDPFDNLEG